MSLTNITAAFLRKADACKDGVAWYDAHPEIHNAEWPKVCAALEEDGRLVWSRWVRRAVAEYGTAEDRAALRNDPDEWVRLAVVKYGGGDPK